MLKDPFYNAIFNALSRKLDVNTFELCVVDLLRETYPTIVSITGGGDSGLDGKIVVPGGVEIPLLCTTAINIKANLKKNLKSYLNSGRPGRECIMVTSRLPSAKKKEDLEKAAADLGFKLLAVIDQEQISHLLRKNPFWCKELLQLSGTPPTLSKSTRVTRPQVGEIMIGRSDALTWINERIEAKEDFLIVGQPGAGKTFMLASLRNKNGYFATHGDLTQLSNDLRELRPSIILVEDGHTKFELLEKLQTIRNTSEQSFVIGVDSWPSGEGIIKSQLGLRFHQSLNLELLNQDQIVEVIETVGIPQSRNNNPYIARIVSQACGRPGLAVALTELSMNEGGVKSVLTGEALTEYLLLSVERISGSKLAETLGVFSLAGDLGVEMKSAASMMGVSAFSLREQLTNLEMAGVIQENSDRISVIPAQLRYILIRDVFFKGAKSLKVQDYSEGLHSKSALLEGLIGAKHRGADIDDDYLFNMLLEVQSSDLWSDYCYLGKRETLRTLSLHNVDLDAIHEAALHFAGADFLKKYLISAQGDLRALHSHPNHPLRRLQDWIRTDSSSEADYDKRALLKDQLEKYAAVNDENSVIEKALPLLVATTWHHNSSDPGSGLSFNMYSGNVDKSLLPHIAENFKEIISLIQTKALSTLVIVDALEQFFECEPRNHLDTELHELKVKLVTPFLKDMDKLTSRDAGCSRRYSGILKQNGIEHSEVIDEAFSTIFPTDTEWDNYEMQSREHLKKVVALANEWEKLPTSETVNKIVLLNRSAESASITWPNYSTNLMSEFAKRTDDLQQWVYHLEGANAYSNLIEPFIVELYNRKSPDLDACIKYLFGSKKYNTLVFSAITQHSNPSKALLDILKEGPSSKDAQNIGFWIRGEKLPLETQRILLKHANNHVAGKAAIYLWRAELNDKNIPHELRDDWIEAILNFREDPFSIKDILSRDHELAFKWCSLRFNKHENLNYQDMEILEYLASRFERSFKVKIIEMLPNNTWFSKFAKKLIGFDKDLFTQLIEKKLKVSLALAPLRNNISQEWLPLVDIAERSGFSVDDVVRESIEYSYLWSGPHSNRWKGLVDLLTQLEKQPGFRGEVLDRLLQYSQEKFNEELATERQSAIYGRN